MPRDYTGRFRVQPRSTRKLLMDDGNLSTGYKIEDIELVQMQGESVDMIVLHTSDRDYNLAPFNIGMEYNQQIGWGVVMNNRVPAAANSVMTSVVIDPDHVIVNDLYVTNTDTDNSCDVLIHLKRLRISPDENILYQIKERAQSDII